MADEPSKEEQEEYIDFLHDRIQFLEEELTESEKSVLELRQKGRTLVDEKRGRRREAVEGLDETKDAVKRPTARSEIPWMKCVVLSTTCRTHPNEKILPKT